MVGRHNKPASGVTLIEVVIAIFVLSVGVMGIMSLFPAGYKLTTRSIERSVSALAARHALGRLAGFVTSATFTPPQPCPISEVERLGTIHEVNRAKLFVKVLGDEKPSSWPTSLGGYYIVMTSGSAEGHIYRINSYTPNDTDSQGHSAASLTFHDNVVFRTNLTESGEPVRVGDTFALIGVPSSQAGATKCFPTNFTNTTSDNRAIPVATYGYPPEGAETSEGHTRWQKTWRYTYGCILSAPSQEMRETLRVDIFVYHGFTPDSNANLAEANELVVGHYVAYLSLSGAVQ